MSDIERKAFAEAIEIKNEAKGEIEAVITTLSVVDHDGDVILPSAIKSGSNAKMSAYAHDTVGGFFGGSAMPVGKGALSVERDKAIYRGKIFLSIARGRETLAVLKEMGADQEWSFGYRVIEAEAPDNEMRQRGARRILTKLNVFEVSPVLLGAGVGTQTVSAKLATAAQAQAIARERSHFERVKANVAALDERHGALALQTAADATRWLSGGRVQTPPLVKFYDGGAGGPRGFWDPTRADSIYLKRDLYPEEIVFVVGHECAHFLYGRDEEAANIWGEYILATYRARGRI